MNTKQLTYPTIEEQKQFWIDKEAQSGSCRTNETREDLKTLFIGTQDNPDDRRQIKVSITDYEKIPDHPKLGKLFTVYDYTTNQFMTVVTSKCGLSGCNCALEFAPPQIHNNNASYTADPKPKDIGGNELPDRIEANEDWYERNDFDRGDLRDEGRNPDGSGESFSERNR